MLNQVEYYQEDTVKQRIAEYCGGNHTTPDGFTSEYLVGYGEAVTWEEINREGFVSTPREGFNWILGKGLDIFRSNWDSESILGILDVEYFNMDYPGEPYLNPERTYTLLEPVYNAIMDVLARFYITPLAVISGRGYNFTSCVRMVDTRAAKELIRIGKVAPSLRAKYAVAAGRRHRPVPLEFGLAHDGMGRLNEYIAHLVIKQVRKKSLFPVVFTDLAVGIGQRGREAISIDLSMYGDPLYMRDIRCPFSSYQKHRVKRYAVGEDVARTVPVHIALPRNGRVSLKDLLAWRSHFRNSAEYASSVKTTIPDCSQGYEKLIRSYKRSRLYRFHKYFDSQEHDDFRLWNRTYDRFNPEELPPCVSHCLLFPNDNLLKPTNLQTLTRVLMKKGWHPKHIAGLVRSKFERDYKWGTQWFKSVSYTHLTLPTN